MAHMVGEVGEGCLDGTAAWLGSPSTTAVSEENKMAGYIKNSIKKKKKKKKAMLKIPPFCCLSRAGELWTGDILLLHE